jgi:hypothetical protein
MTTAPTNPRLPSAAAPPAPVMARRTYVFLRLAMVGALAALGVGMIALWGKTPIEDAFLNLAGMLAPVVAFVPTSRTNLCGLTTTSGVDLAAKSQTNPKAAQAAKARPA